MTYEILLKIVYFLVGLSIFTEPPATGSKTRTGKREIRIKQKICTEVGCEDEVSDFDPPISSPGNYVFQFSYPNGSRICEYHLPTDDKDFCGNDIYILRKDTNSHKPKTNVIQTISGMTISMAPKTFTLNIIRDGKKILTQTHSPNIRNTNPMVKIVHLHVNLGNSRYKYPTISNSF